MSHNDTLQMLPFVGDAFNFCNWTTPIDDLLDVNSINLDFIDLNATGALLPKELIFKENLPPAMVYNPDTLLSHSGTMLTCDTAMYRERFIAAIMHEVCRPTAEQVAKQQIEISIRKQVKRLSGPYDALMAAAADIREKLETEDNIKRHAQEISIRRENTSDILIGTKTGKLDRLKLAHIVAYTHARDMLKARVSGHGYWEDEVSTLPNRPLLHIVHKNRGTSAVDEAYSWYTAAYRGIAYAMAQI